jgi:hypothetical protein
VLLGGHQQLGGPSMVGTSRSLGGTSGGGIFITGFDSTYSIATA